MTQPLFSVVFVLACGLTVSVAKAQATSRRVEPKAEEFDLSQVRLLPGPFKANQDLDAKYLLSLDPDRLLHVFRLNANLPTTAQPLGGWEAPKCELRGHFVGHYLSGLALMYASTGDERFKQRADAMVAELAKCQEALGGQYLSAFPESFFDRLESTGKVWAPYYTIHKIMAGLLDVNHHCHNPQALDVCTKMASYFKKRIDSLSDEQMQSVMKTEFGGMMEVLANLSAVTGNASWLALAKRFDHRAVFDPLAAREDKLARLHANTQIPKMTGSARVFELSGDERYRTVAEFFWDAVTAHHSFIVGGNSFHEHFDLPDIEASKLAPDTAESCNTYNMLKLTRHLFALEPKAKYADFYERALYNHILGSIDPESGMTMYFLSLKPGHFKVYGTPLDSFWCCTGTGVENHAKYGDSIYAHKGDTLWVNLFIPSELRWPDKGVAIVQQTSFPEDSTTTLTINPGMRGRGEPHKLSVKLRVPSWTTGAAVKVNGQEQPLKADESGYATLSREWHDGDTIEYSVPMNLHVYQPPDEKSTIAILDGPVVLAGELGRANLPPSDQAHDQKDYNNVPTPPVPVLAASASADPSHWLQPVSGKALTFTASAAGEANKIELIPLYQLHHQRYSVYWKLSEPAAAAQ